MAKTALGVDQFTHAAQAPALRADECMISNFPTKEARRMQRSFTMLASPLYSERPMMRLGGRVTSLWDFARPMAMTFATDKDKSSAAPDQKKKASWADKNKAKTQQESKNQASGKGGEEESLKYFEKPPHQQNVRNRSCPIASDNPFQLLRMSPLDAV